MAAGSRPGRTVDGVSYRIQRYRPRIEGLFARIERWRDRGRGRDALAYDHQRQRHHLVYGADAGQPHRRPGRPEPRVQLADLRDLRRQRQRRRLRLRARGQRRSRCGACAASATGTRRPGRRSRYLKRIRYGNREPYFPVLRSDAPWPRRPTPRRPTAATGSSNSSSTTASTTRTHRVPAETGAWPAAHRPVLHLPGRASRCAPTGAASRILMFHHFPRRARRGRGLPGALHRPELRRAPAAAA